MATQNANKLKYEPFKHQLIPAQMELLIKSNKGLRNFYLSQFKNDNAQEDVQTNKINGIGL